MINTGGSEARFPDRVRLPLQFDAHAMAADLVALQDGWIEHFVKQNYSGDWSVIPLRAPAGETHPIRMIYPDPSATAWVDTPWLERSPVLRNAIAAFHCPVMTARLSPCRFSNSKPTSSKARFLLVASTLTRTWAAGRMDARRFMVGWNRIMHR